MTETVDDPRVSQLSTVGLVCELCRRVGLEPDDVRQLKLTPSKLTAHVYKRNPDGRKYLGVGGEPAIEIWEVQLRP